MPWFWTSRNLSYLAMVGSKKVLYFLLDSAYGFNGIIAGAAAVFFAYIGFDAVSTQAAEAKNPRKDIPFAIIASLLICTFLYILMYFQDSS